MLNYVMDFTFDPRAGSS